MIFYTSTFCYAQNNLSGINIDCPNIEKLKPEEGKKIEIHCEILNKNGIAIINQVTSPSGQCEWVYNQTDKSRQPILPNKPVDVKVVCGPFKAHEYFNKSFNFEIQDSAGKVNVVQKKISGSALTKNELTYKEAEYLKSSNARCSNIRLDSKGGSMEHVPPMVQYINNCYAHSASQMYDAYRFSHGDKNYNKLTSRVSSSIIYKKKVGKKQLDRGSVGDTLNELLNKPPCPVTKIVYSATDDDQKSPVEAKEFFVNSFTDSLSSIKNDYLKNQPRTKNDSLQLEHAFDKRTKNATLVCSKNGSTPLTGTPNLIKYIKNDDIIGALEHTIDTNCSEKEKLKIKKPYVVNEKFIELDNDNLVGHTLLDSQKEIMNQIHDQLDQGIKNTPIGLVICANSLIKNKISEKIPFSDCKSHALLIIGRRLNKNTNNCEFLIRNSWGQNVETGWHDATDLMKTTIAITTIK